MIETVDCSTHQLLELINQQINFQETLSEYLSKAEAMAHVTIGDDFLDYPESILHNYLWALRGIIEHAKNINQKALNIWMKNRPLTVFEQ